MRIMIVEEDALVSDSILVVLENSPHEVAGVAETGAEALRLAEHMRLDVAIVNILLGGRMNGLQNFGEGTRP